MGHDHPHATPAVQGQVRKGTHYGPCHALGVAWDRFRKTAHPETFNASPLSAAAGAAALEVASTGEPRQPGVAPVPSAAGA